MNFSISLVKVNNVNGSSIDNVWLADNSWTRFRGLLGRPKLDLNQGLLLDPCNSVHTFWMRYAIDIVYLDRQKKVISIQQHLKPWRASINKKAKYVLELASGSAEYNNLNIGDKLRW